MIIHPHDDLVILKVGLSRLVAFTKDRAISSTMWYIVSGSCCDRLTKYIGYWVPTDSWVMAALTVPSVAVM